MPQHERIHDPDPKGPLPKGNVQFNPPPGPLRPAGCGATMAQQSPHTTKHFEETAAQHTLEELTMRTRYFLAATIAALVFPLYHADSRAAQTDALTGKVTSTEEGAMEGVLVSAKKADSNKTITVVSDDKGVYRFPANR